MIAEELSTTRKTTYLGVHNGGFSKGGFSNLYGTIVQW